MADTDECNELYRHDVELLASKLRNEFERRLECGSFPADIHHLIRQLLERDEEIEVDYPCGCIAVADVPIDGAADGALKRGEADAHLPKALQRPYLLSLSSTLYALSNSKLPPQLRMDWPFAEGFVEDTSERRFLSACQPALATLVHTVVSSSTGITVHNFTETAEIVDSGRKTPIEYLVDLLTNFRCIHTLLGLRVTVGSVPRLPPPLRTLYNSFNIQHNSTKPEDSKARKYSVLTVGARALLKHCHRGSDSWWGKPSGPESRINDIATAKLQQIIGSAVWVNMHTLPHDEWVLEIRTMEGYGSRWTADGSKFRGFLEPPMSAGHESKWRH